MFTSLQNVILSIISLKFQIQSDQTALICEECKNLLIQFHVFKNNVRKSSLLLDDNLTNVMMFLEENENEEVFCIRYNKCLTLVPDSKRTFMEIFKHWQPHVILEKLDELPPPQKRAKIKQSGTKSEFNSKEEVLEIEVIENEAQNSDSEEHTLEIVEENHPEGMTEEEWLEMELSSSEIVETEEGEVESWLCTHCDPFERYLDSNDFRAHLTTMHLDAEHVVYDEDEVVQEFESSSQSEMALPPDDITTLSESQDQKNLVVSDYFNCTNCTYTTVNRHDFKMHQKTHVDQRQFQTTRFERLFCVDCSYQFTTQAHYQAHVNGHQLYEIVAKHASYPICELCNMMFCEDSFANFHQEKHELGASTDDVIAAEGGFLKFGHHRPEVENENDSLSEDALKCGHCLRKFADEESCRLHQLIFHITILKCPIESRVFNGNQAFSIHLKNNHPELFGDVKFRCSVCKMEFDTLYEKLGHMKNCDKKKFQCSHCDKKFSQKCYLMTHLRQISGQTSVVCEVCQKVCRDKGDYQIHFR